MQGLGVFLRALAFYLDLKLAGSAANYVRVPIGCGIANGGSGLLPHADASATIINTGEIISTTTITTTEENLRALTGAASASKNDVEGTMGQGDATASPAPPPAATGTSARQLQQLQHLC